ncbi:MAG: DUF1127 domain-containing protein [Saccharospirillum sp.]|uniref:DUF1127 domain-containing protein n=1 Tax=Saccharospirillum TaxID=231683 RepID=UPI000FD89303|nr:DUF1127 domain-containing protein [Saccharospirillum alexandrii]
MTAIGLNTLVQLPAKAPVPEFYMPSMPPLHLFATAGRLYRAWQYRNKLISLTRYDDATLEDIGYTRAELKMAIAMPLSQDPRPVLKQWRAQRRITG